jgi:DNA-binding CsgD family transcriptional regulator
MKTVRLIVSKRQTRPAFELDKFLLRRPSAALADRAVAFPDLPVAQTAPSGADDLLDDFARAYLLQSRSPAAGESLRSNPPRSASERDGVSAATLSAAIERLPLGVAIVDARGAIVVMNEPAQRILARRDGLATSGRCLVAHLPSETKRLCGLIRDTLLLPEGAWPARGTVAISRPSGRQPFILVVRPLRSCSSSCISVCGRSQILINDLEWPQTEYRPVLQHTFGLTTAEAEVAISIMDGYEPRQIAQRRGVRVSTIRTQIRTILAKTGVGRQIDLVKLIARLPQIDPR